MADYGDMPYGLNDVKLTNLAGDSQEDLPAARELRFQERIKSGEIRGDDSLQAVAATTEALDFALEAGGISLEAYALMTGRTAVEAGTTPNQTNTLTVVAGEAMPYFKIYGKSLGDGDGDIHVKLRKCKVTGGLDGQLRDGEFYVTKCSGVCVDDGTAIMEVVQNETAAALPAT